MSPPSSLPLWWREGFWEDGLCGEGGRRRTDRGGGEERIGDIGETMSGTGESSLFSRLGLGRTGQEAVVGNQSQGGLTSRGPEEAGKTGASFGISCLLALSVGSGLSGTPPPPPPHPPPPPAASWNAPWGRGEEEADSVSGSLAEK